MTETWSRSVQNGVCHCCFFFHYCHRSWNPLFVILYVMSYNLIVHCCKCYVCSECSYCRLREDIGNFLHSAEWIYLLDDQRPLEVTLYLCYVNPNKKKRQKLMGKSAIFSWQATAKMHVLHALTRLLTLKCCIHKWSWSIHWLGITCSLSKLLGSHL